jgi:methyl-accepting chemotaxis protein
MGIGFLKTVKFAMDESGKVMTAFFAGIDKGWVEVQRAAQQMWVVIKTAFHEGVAAALTPLRKLLEVAAKITGRYQEIADAMPRLGDATAEAAKEIEVINAAAQRQKDIIDENVDAYFAQVDAEIKLRDEMAKTSKELKRRAKDMQFTEDMLGGGTGLKDKLTALQQYEKTLMDTMKAEELYSEKIVLLHQLYLDGSISIRVFKQELESLERTYGRASAEMKKGTDEMADMWQTLGEKGIGQLADQILDADRSFNEFAQNFIRQMAQMIAKQQIMNSLQAAGGLGGLFGGARMAGGPVMAGGRYLVGEAGPELFVPDRSGQILPNAGATEVNVYNSTTSQAIVKETANSRGGKTIDIMIEEAVRKSFTRGGQDKIMRSVYGVQRRGR